MANRIESSTKFCHYTSTRTAGDILSAGMFYLSRLDQMNDLLEYKQHEDEANRIYVLSFCHSEARSIPMFYLYGGIDGKGCRIEFTAAKIREILNTCEVFPVNEKYKCLKKSFEKDEYDIFSNWTLYKPREKEIGFRNGKPISEEAYREFFSKEENWLFVKAPWWGYEKEFRIVIRFKEDINRERIAIKYSVKEKEKGISMMCGPEVEEKELEEIRREFIDYGIQKIERVEPEVIKMGLLDRNKALLKNR